MSFQAIVTVSKWHNVARNYVKMIKMEQKNRIYVFYYLLKYIIPER